MKLTASRGRDDEKGEMMKKRNEEYQGLMESKDDFRKDEEQCCEAIMKEFSVICKCGHARYSHGPDQCINGLASGICGQCQCMHFKTRAVRGGRVRRMTAGVDRL